MSRFFCGPDTTPWVSVRYDTPKLAVKTLLEALRRDDPEVICFCLSQDYQKRLGVDHQTVRLAWPRIREQNPGLHLAGYTEVPEPRQTGRDQATVRLEVHGSVIEIQLVRQLSWEVRYRRADGTSDGDGAQLTSFVGSLLVEPAEDENGDPVSRLVATPRLFHHDGLVQVTLDAIDRFACTSDWKVADIRQQD